MRWWPLLPILMLLLMSSCAGTASLPPTAKMDREQAAKTHLPRPMVHLTPAQAQDPVKVKEALHDLKLQSDAVYDDYLKRQ